MSKSAALQRVCWKGALLVSDSEAKLIALIGRNDNALLPKASLREGHREKKGVKKILIAIDGPAGPGKSTTARLVARRLGYVYLDTGAMYRAITLKVLMSHLDPANQAEAAKLAADSDINFVNNGTQLRVVLDGEDVTERIRSVEVTKNVSLISSYPGVRKVMVEKQRAIGSAKGCVVDGRDIGTVVFPEADLKFYITADIMERARRRQAELSENGTELPIVQVVQELKERDLKDSTRETSPLRKADGAIEIDTTNLSIEEQVAKVLSYVNENMMTSQKPAKERRPDGILRNRPGREEK